MLLHHINRRKGTRGADYCTTILSTRDRDVARSKEKRYYLMVIGIKKKKQEVYRSLNSTDMKTMTKLVTYGGDI